MKITGAEYKAFINANWDTLLGVTGAYMDGYEITVNGEEEPFDIDGIPDDAKVVIKCGYVAADQDIDMSVKTAFNKWKKAQKVTILVIEIPNEFVDYMKGQVSTCKGKIL